MAAKEMGEMAAVRVVAAMAMATAHTVREKVGLATLTKKPNGACPGPLLARPGPSWHEFGG